jgi:chromosomal replication initiation ATPase DnaA
MEKWMSLLTYIIDFQKRSPNGMYVKVASNQLIHNIALEVIYDAGISNHINYLGIWLKTFKHIYKPEVGLYIKRFRAKPEYTPEYFKNITCTFFNIPVELMDSPTRKREIVQARQIAMFISKHRTKQSLAQIGLEIGDKDHATVLHACKTIQNLLDTDRRFRAQFEDLERRIK